MPLLWEGAGGERGRKGGDCSLACVVIILPPPCLTAKKEANSDAGGRGGSLERGMCPAVFSSFFQALVSQEGQ